MDKKIIVPVFIAVVVAGSAGFFVGKSVSAGSTSSVASQRAGQFFTRQGVPGGRLGMAGAGFVAGDILSKDSQSLTLKLQDGGSKIVFFSDSTAITKNASGTPNDLVVGKQAVVSGTPNADGSITAQTIQLRSSVQRSASVQ